MRKSNSMPGRRRGRLGMFIAWMLSLLAIMAIAATIPTPASAEGFLQSLFGIGKKKQAVRPRQKIRRSNYGGSKRSSWPLTLPYRLPGYRYERNRKPRRRRSSNRSGRTGSYRTMCVRQCDGYYFPIGYGVSRSRFTKDANVCRAKCNSPAKLYTLSVHQQPSDMVDLRGRAYRKTKNAFLFRKKRVAGCGCRPPAWSAAETDRHKFYELNETLERKLARQEGDIKFIAGLTKVRKSVRYASKRERAAKAASDKQRQETLRLRALQKQNEAKALGHVGDREGPRQATDSAANGVSIAPQISSVIGQTLAPNAAVELGEPSPQLARQTRQRQPNRRRPVRRRARLSFDDGTYRSRRKRSRVRRGVARPAPIRIKRRAASKKSTSGFGKIFGLGAKPKYRWPGD